MIPGCRVVVHESGTANQLGVDFGGKGPKLVEHCGNYALFHIPGGMSWGGNGMPWHYNPASYEIVQMKNVEFPEKIPHPPGWQFTAKVVDIIERREPGKSWRREREEMLARLRVLGGAR